MKKWMETYWTELSKDVQASTSGRKTAQKTFRESQTKRHSRKMSVGHKLNMTHDENSHEKGSLEICDVKLNECQNSSPFDFTS